MTKRTSTKRAETERRERRMKRGDVVADGRKLVVPESEKDVNQFSYRFAADRPGRVQQLEKQDWDIVPDMKDTPHGGAEENGKPYGMVLMRKYRDWYEEDQKEKQRPADMVDEALLRNQAQDIAGTTDADLAEHAYVPGSGNKMDVSRGYKP